MKTESIFDRMSSAKDSPKDSKKYGQLQLSESNKHHLMLILTNMYQEPVVASIREYLSNAMDAQVRAKNFSDAIEISWTGDSFSVRDYGTGMDREDLESKFFFYGEGDKKDSLEEIGGFGLGCKAGLAVNGVLHVSTWKDGVESKATAIFDDTVNVVEYSEPVSSTEKSGTLITVPFKTYTSHKKMEEIFYKQSKMLTFWDDSSIPLSVQGSLYVPDKVSTPILNSILSFTDSTIGCKVWLVPKSYNYGYRYFVISLGGVAYNVDVDKLRLDDSILKLLFPSYNVNYHRKDYVYYIDVPMSSFVKLTPSRDNIIYSEKTINSLERIIISVVENTVLQVRNIVESTEISDMKAVICKFGTFVWQQFNPHVFNWRGIQISSQESLASVDDLQKYSKSTVRVLSDVKSISRDYSEVKGDPNFTAMSFLIQIDESCDVTSKTFINTMERNILSFKKYYRSLPQAESVGEVKYFHFYITKNVELYKKNIQYSSFFKEIFDSLESFNEAGLTIRKNFKSKAVKDVSVEDRDEKPRHYMLGQFSNVSNELKYSGATLVSNNELKEFKQYVTVDVNTLDMLNPDFMKTALAKNEVRYFNANNAFHLFAQMFPDVPVIIIPSGRQISVVTKLNGNFATMSDFLIGELQKEGTLDSLESYLLEGVLHKHLKVCNLTPKFMKSYPKLSSLVLKLQNDPGERLKDVLRVMEKLNHPSVSRKRGSLVFEHLDVHNNFWNLIFSNHFSYSLFKESSNFRKFAVIQTIGSSFKPDEELRELTLDMMELAL